MSISRQVAFDVLRKVFSDEAYSNIALDEAVKLNNLSKLDSAFCTALVYGVLERLYTLDYIIRKTSSVPFRKIELDTLIILRMGLYQIIYMDKVPDNASVNESVNLAKKKKLFKSSGFINGMLRSFIRNGSKVLLPPEDDTLRYLSVKYSCPEYLCKLWLEQYGLDVTTDILETLSGRPPLFAHVNTLLTDEDTLIDNLNRDGVKAEKSTILPNMLTLRDTGDLTTLNAFQKGEFFIQDMASAVCAELTGVKPSDVVYDVCSAPGGKSFAMAIKMDNKGEVYSFDLHPHKIKLICDGANRLGISIIKASVRNAETDNTELKEADVVLCDVPCSGFGVLRRKPEIRYTKEADFTALPKVQFNILQNSAKLVKKGGTLVYSTCTLNNSENREVVERFLSSNPDFIPMPIENLPQGIERKIAEPSNMITLFPTKEGSDGFFVCILKRGEL